MERRWIGIHTVCTYNILNKNKKDIRERKKKGKAGKGIFCVRGIWKCFQVRWRKPQGSDRERSQKHAPGLS